jgi:SSS family solute:Na+ symporter
VFGLFFGWFGSRALLSGWAVGIGTGSWLAFSDGIKPIHAIMVGGDSYTVYTGLLALALNVLVAVLVQLCSAKTPKIRNAIPEKLKSSKT